MNFLDAKDSEKLKKANAVTCNGLFCLFDIKDSTKRKKEYKNKWQLHTEAVYNAFFKFINQIQIDKLNLAAYKFLGDGMMAFFKYSDSTSTPKNESLDEEIGNKFLSEIYTFWNSINSSEEELCDLKLKCVVTYLSGIYIAEIDQNYDNKSKLFDVLGRGIDFSFRLEKFSDHRLIIINEMLKKALVSENENTINISLKKVGGKTETLELDFHECKKMFKGWDSPEGETFYFLVSFKDIIANKLDSAPSPFSQDLNEELLQYFVNKFRNNEENLETWKVKK